MYWPQIVHTWMFGQMPLEQIAEKLQRAGMDGVDLSIGQWGTLSPQRLLELDIQKILTNYGLKAYAASALYFQPEIDLSSDDAKVRKRAVDFSKRCVDVTVHAGCDRMLVSPSLVSNSCRLHKGYTQDWNWAVDSVREIAEYAVKQNIKIMIEPINRYRVTLIHTVKEAMQFCQSIGMPNLTIVPDTYHMQLEENEDLCVAIRKAGDQIACLHIGDSARCVPGQGHVDWYSILYALQEIGFSGALSHEPVTRYFDMNKVANDLTYSNMFEAALRSGVVYIQKIMAEIKDV